MNNKLMTIAESGGIRKVVPQFGIGDTVDVHQRILEGDKERIQVFSGLVIAKKGEGVREMFTVRRIIHGEGVERIYPLHSPKVADVVVKRAGQVRRAKLYYLRDRIGKKAVHVRKRKIPVLNVSEGTQLPIAGSDFPAHDTSPATPFPTSAVTEVTAKPDGKRETPMLHRPGEPAPSPSPLPTLDLPAGAPPTTAPPVPGPTGEVTNWTTQDAPRVLNANFATTSCIDDAIDPGTALIAGNEYTLLVDVGPIWPDTKSVVVSNKKEVFPVESLPADKEGYKIQVIVISDDFEPRMAEGWIWVPRRTGASTPFHLGHLVDKPGPLALILRAHTLNESNNVTTATARARLCLYYETNLLQSARLRFGLSRTPSEAHTERNEIVVDYVLIPEFRNIEHFAFRSVTFGNDDDSGKHPVALNITLNGDGVGGHRILVKEQGDTPPGYMPYDPEDAKSVLDDSRRTLGDCFFLRREDKGYEGTFVGGSERQISLNLADNSKSINQFKFDLRYLAEIGSELHDKIFTQIQPGDRTLNQAEWIDRLRNTLADPKIIQISRTGLANYIFPWGLVYEHPLWNPNKYQFCKIVSEEWGDRHDSFTQAVPSKRCKYHDHDWHRENILCPYGFWGLKHIIEQPPSEEGDKRYIESSHNDERSIRVKPPVNLGVAVSLDERFDEFRMRAHLQFLTQLGQLRFQLPPATDWPQVQTMFQAPGLIYYFLCHDEHDEQQRDSYLSVGRQDRIYARRLVGWLRAQKPEAWKQRRPLVFINGCHTADLRPGQVLSFVPAFTAAGAGGVIGTEVSVVFQVAVEVGESLLKKLAAGIPVGQAMRAVRWELARKGNLLGLAYTMYCLADLRFLVGGTTTPVE